MVQLSNQKIISLIEKARKGVVHIEFIFGNDVVASGSGFISNGHLITNNHVFAGLSGSNVRMSWQPLASPNSLKCIEVPYQKFFDSLKAGSDKDNADYAILNIPELNVQNLHNLTLAVHEKYIGDEALILGFPLEHQNLVCHRAMISSFYTCREVNVIQLDASVNNSNSGGPLIDPISGDVIGIITRKGTGLSKSFSELEKSFDKIGDVLKNMTRVRMGSLDLNGTVIEVQQQMKRLSKEIFRSANVGIGYAFSVEHILQEFRSLQW